MAIPKVGKYLLCMGIFLGLTGCGQSATESLGLSTDLASTGETSVDSAEARVELFSDISTVDYDGSITLFWQTENVTDCVALGDWSGARPDSGSEIIPSLVSDSTFELACNEIETGAEATATRGRMIKAMVNVSVRGPRLPGLTLSASPSTVPANGSTTITWDSERANSCTASGDWSGSKSRSGSQTFNNLVSDSTYRLSCTGAGGSVEQTVDVVIAAPSAPWVNLSANPSSVVSGANVVLNWNSGNADSCTASGDWSGSKTTSGSQTVGPISADSRFTLTCTGAGGSANNSADVTVTAPAPTVTLSATPNRVNQGESTTLVWNSTNATSCTASLDWSGSKSTSGSQTISGLNSDSDFRLVCEGPGGTASTDVDVSVSLVGSGTALLSWTPPTQNSDGSSLSNLAGYRIRYGTSPGNYSETITINNAGLSSYLVENLGSASWYFVMTSFNSDGVESVFSTEVSKTIN